MNGEIPIGSVPISTISSKHLEPVFIARGAFRHSSYTGIAKMNGTMRMTMPDQDGDTEDEARCETLTEFEVLVAKNVKHRRFNRVQSKIQLAQNVFHSF